MTPPTQDEAKRFNAILKKLFVMPKDYHSTRRDLDKCYRVNTGRAQRGPTWSGTGAPGIRLGNCAFYADSFFGITAYVDVQERWFFGLLPGPWKHDQYMGCADGPWWGTFRKALVAWEHEIELPENQPGWHERECAERRGREMETRRIEREASEKKARRAFRT